MKKLTSKVLLIAISIFTVMCLASQVFASDLLIVDDGANTTNTSASTLNSLTSLNSSNTANTSNVSAGSILNSTSKNNTAANTSTYNKATNTTLPKTGSDYTLSIVLVACVASAIFAFIRIRNYKNI